MHMNFLKKELVYDPIPMSEVKKKKWKAPQL